MPLIEVHIPFTLRLCRECKGRHFHKGQHEVSRQELGHWFVQGCIAEGRAVVVPVPEQAMEIVEPGAPANHDEFADAMNLTIGVELAAIPAAKAPAKMAAKPKAKGK